MVGGFSQTSHITRLAARIRPRLGPRPHRACAGGDHAFIGDVVDVRTRPAPILIGYFKFAGRSPAFLLSPEFSVSPNQCVCDDRAPVVAPPFVASPVLPSHACGAPREASQGLAARCGPRRPLPPPLCFRRREAAAADLRPLRGRATPSFLLWMHSSTLLLNDLGKATRRHTRHAASPSCPPNPPSTRAHSSTPSLLRAGGQGPGRRRLCQRRPGGARRPAGPRLRAAG